MCFAHQREATPARLMILNKDIIKYVITFAHVAAHVGVLIRFARVKPIMINRLFKAIIVRDDPFGFESS